MDPLWADFAGAERAFRLRFGEIVDIEQACGKVGVGAIYQRLATTTYFANDVKQILLRALVGGGLTVRDATALVEQQLDAKPLAQLGALAQDIILALMTGIDPEEEQSSGDPSRRLDAGRLFHQLVQLGLSPQQVREMRYDDFVALMRAAGNDGVSAPSEEEFEGMLASWRSRQE